MKTLFVTASLYLLAILLVSPTVAQEVIQEDVTLPDSVMQHVVRRILAEKISSRPTPRKIYLSDRNLRSEWLPIVPNVKFVLVADSQLDAVSGQVNFFKKPRLVDGVYEIDYGYGDPQCRAIGRTWYFRITGNRVGFLEKYGGWGMGCA